MVNSSSESPTLVSFPTPHSTPETLKRRDNFLDGSSIKTQKLSQKIFSHDEEEVKNKLRSEKKWGKFYMTIETIFLVITSVTLVSIPFFLILMNKSSEQINKFKQFKSDLNNVRKLDQIMDTRLNKINELIINLKTLSTLDSNDNINTINFIKSKLRDSFSKSKEKYINSKDYSSEFLEKFNQTGISKDNNSKKSQENLISNLNNSKKDLDRKLNEFVSNYEIKSSNKKQLIDSTIADLKKYSEELTTNKEFFRGTAEAELAKYKN